MIEFTKNWIDFFRNNNIKPEYAYEAYSFVAKYTTGALLSLSEIKNVIHCSDLESVLIAKQLVACGLANFLPLCPTCETPLPEEKIWSNSVFTCEVCNSEISTRAANFIVISEKASYQSHVIKKIEEESYEFNAELLVQVGTAHQVLYYLISDIEGSQTLQAKDNQTYATYLEFLWHHVWPKALRNSKKVYLPLLAKGDAVSIVFSDYDDCAQTILGIPDELSSMPALKLSLFLGAIRFDASDRSGFLRSLDKKWDLNTPAVTNLYRKSAAIKPEKWKSAEKNYRIKVAILDDLIGPIQENFPVLSAWERETYQFKDKHENSYKGEYIAGVL